jgi:hypothetical protein
MPTFRIADDRQRHWAILALKDIIDLPDSSLREEVLALAAIERLLERSEMAPPTKS